MLKNCVFACKKNVPLLLALSWDEIKVRYARSVLGPFWLVLTTAISALGLGYVWSILLHQDKATFIPALCVGLVIWQFLSACVTEASSCFNTYTPIIKNVACPVLVFPAAIVIKNFVIFLHNCVIIACVLLIYPPKLHLNILMFFPGLLLVLLNLICVVTILGFIGARFRDVGPAIASLMTILFFLSPVIYKPEQLGIRAHLMWLNPFSYFITLIRDPLTGFSAPVFVYVVMTGTLLIGSLLTGFVVSRYRYRLVFWL